MSKKYERTKSAHKPEEKAHQILTPAAARAIRKVTKADEKKDDEEKEQTSEEKKTTETELKSIFYYRHHQSQRFEKKVEDGDSYM